MGIVATAIALTAATVVLLHRREYQAEHDAVVRMAPENRRAMFDDTRKSAELICAQARAEAGLADRCIETRNSSWRSPNATKRALRSCACTSARPPDNDAPLYGFLTSFGSTLTSSSSEPSYSQGTTMLDIVFVGLALTLFALTLGLVRICERV
jgi:hypothetical protein